MGASASVSAKCLRPTRGAVAASSGRTRAVPSGSALPGQGASSHRAAVAVNASANIPIVTMEDRIFD